ncbi:MAG: hypothetical protein NTZ33_15625 [Bacteroidetes bacterium]|nr:hypothetical protein [Bacteroidota bacterium]
MKIKVNILITLMIIILSSCTGLKILPTSSVSFPPELGTRFYLEKIGTNANNLQDLPGRLIIFYNTPQGIKYEVTLDKFINSEGKVRSIDKPAIRYQSMVNKDIASKISYIIGNYDFSISASYQIVVTDATGVVLDNNDKQRSEIEKAEFSRDYVKILYITGATLVTIQSKSFASTSHNGTISGYGVNLGGNYCYSNNDYSLDFKIGVDVYDVTYYNFKNKRLPKEYDEIFKDQINLKGTVILLGQDDEVYKKDILVNASIENLKKLPVNKTNFNKLTMSDMNKLINNNNQAFSNIIIR